MGGEVCRVDPVVPGLRDDDATQLIAGVDGCHRRVAVAGIDEQGAADLEMLGAVLGDEPREEGDEQAELHFGEVEAAGVVGVNEGDVGSEWAVVVCDA